MRPERWRAMRAGSTRFRRCACIINGRLLRQAGFEQLVDPGRNIPAASIPIHGITPAMVAGQPTIDQVLPVFHAFSQDTVPPQGLFARAQRLVGQSAL